MENREFARVLAETADLMEIAGEDPFRIRSYRNAASAIESSGERVDELLRTEGRSVTEIPGVGKGIASAIAEISQRGSFERRDQLLEKYPPTALELLKIQGLGPKTIAMLWEHYRISTVDDLEKICQEQKLRGLPRLGAKTEEKILKAICGYRQRAGRILLSTADQLATELCDYLSQTPGVEQVTKAGSVRRGRETAGDIDILVTGPDPGPALDRFVHHPRVGEVLVHGGNKASARVGLQNVQVDVRALPRESFGAALQYFTGSKDHNVALRQRALRLGYTLNEYGLFRLEDNARAAGETEEEIYAKLQMAWIPPELRENQGEIECAVEGRLPALVEAHQIRGDLHMHTTETDGRASLEEMAAAAKALGYEYIAITDHSKALAMANGLDEVRAIAFAARVRGLDPEELGIHVLSGIECDIRRDGTMDLEDDALAALDFVIGSVHSYMNLEPAEMTDRLLRALACPHVHALGHLTGRVLMSRDPYPFDFERVASEAARRNVWLEINASPERLDLYDTLLRVAKARGCRFVISTDAHHPKHLLNMRYGVTMARRGWLEAGDVGNTRTLAGMKELKARG
ncbi:MAG TPA: DNA polymerase/3'-5' exonuclease PolX [Bryobacteraceae bacterium]|nr:DNA polymerase/3'-5' exonuclease PolX [Bryobacteraceae bacterium]